MTLYCLQFFVKRVAKKEGIPLFEWLLKKGKEMQLSVGSAYQSVASFSEEGPIHEEKFLELGTEHLTITVLFILSQEQGRSFISFLKKEAIEGSYILFPVEGGKISLKN